MKTITRSFCPADRYKYDFKECTPSQGWAQLDTSQDASYFGTWINPSQCQILCYCEGDVTLCLFDTDDELVAELELIKRWNLENGHRFIGIDPLMVPALAEACVKAGLKDYITPGAVENIGALAERIFGGKA